MKKIALLILLIVSLHAQENFHKEFSTLTGAVGTFQHASTQYKSNIYLYQNENGAYHVEHDPEFTLETSNSFLQIYSSKFFEFTLEHYEKIKDKKHLYIKKFNSLYFLRLSNKSPEHTRNMFIELQEEFPDIYYSKAATKPVKKVFPVDNKNHTIVFLDEKKEKLTTNLLKETVFSLSPDQKLPSIQAKRINREGDLDKIYDLKDYISNFSIVRGDVLGVSNAGLYGLEAYTNYGILCSHGEDLLYLVSTKEIKSIYDLRKKTISVGNISDIAQIYLKDIANNSGIILDINFKSYNYKDSIDKMQKGEIDAFFLFAPKNKVLEIVKSGLHISSIPNDFLKVLNEKQGINSVKYKINDRLIRSYKVPNYVIGIVQTLDPEMPKKVRSVVEAFGCYKQSAIPDAFYGNLHPELINIIAAMKAEDAAAAEAKKLLDEKNSAITIDFYKEAKKSNEKIYYYQITNISSDDVNLTYEMAKTKALDEYAFKPHHLLKLELDKPIIEVKANNKKIISFRYSNPFSTRLKNLELELKFKKTDLSGQEFVVPLVIGDE